MFDVCFDERSGPHDAFSPHSTNDDSEWMLEYFKWNYSAKWKRPRLFDMAGSITHWSMRCMVIIFTSGLVNSGSIFTWEYFDVSWNDFERQKILFRYLHVCAGSFIDRKRMSPYVSVIQFVFHAAASHNKGQSPLYLTITEVIGFFGFMAT